MNNQPIVANPFVINNTPIITEITSFKVAIKSFLPFKKLTTAETVNKIPNTSIASHNNVQPNIIITAPITILIMPSLVFLLTIWIIPFTINNTPATVIIIPTTPSFKIQNNAPITMYNNGNTKLLLFFI